MGCGSCGTGSGGCSSGCGKLDVHDWLKDMSRPMSPFDVVEIRFKGGQKEFYRNVHNLELYTGDIVVVESSSGHHVGEITMQGEIVRLQLKKKKITYDDNLPVIYRKATEKDIEKFEEARNRELPTLYRTRQIVRELKLNMKMSDVEYQADNTKASFFYSSEGRVDFRELIKLLAGEFKIRVEMKQISLRQEASRLGGIGSCGRELCCSTWLTDFKNVTTSAARYQNLSLNPAKLSGQCGRLKCCINYELDTYMDAIKTIPKADKPLKTEMGLLFHQKTDIFKRLMWFAYKGETNWVELTADRVKEIIDLNKQGISVFSHAVDQEVIEEKLGGINDDLQSLDNRLALKNPPKNKRKKSNRNPNNKRQEGQGNKETRPPNPKKQNNPNSKRQSSKNQEAPKENQNPNQNPKRQNVRARANVVNPETSKKSEDRTTNKPNRPKRQNVKPNDNKASES